MPNRPQDAVQLELPYPPPYAPPLIAAAEPVRTQKRWVLVETLATKRAGKPVYFEKMTGIGPRCTTDLKLAEKFDEKIDAALSPAMRHMMSCFEPQEVEVPGGT